MSPTAHRHLTQSRPLLIACGILKPEIERLTASGEIEADAVFLNKYLHMDYGKLHAALKAALAKNRAQKPVVVYGDVCLGFHSEMQRLMDEFDAVKVDGLNCIDCLLGGRGRLLEIDPDHLHFFVTPGFVDFSERLLTDSIEENRRRFKMLKGIILVDSLGDLERCRSRIDHFSEQTGLPVVEHMAVGLEGLKSVIADALRRALQRAEKTHGDENEPAA